MSPTRPWILITIACLRRRTPRLSTRSLSSRPRQFKLLQTSSATSWRTRPQKHFPSRRQTPSPRKTSLLQRSKGRTSRTLQRSPKRTSRCRSDVSLARASRGSRQAHSLDASDVDGKCPEKRRRKGFCLFPSVHPHPGILSDLSGQKRQAVCRPSFCYNQEEKMPCFVSSFAIGDVCIVVPGKDPCTNRLFEHFLHVQGWTAH